MPTPSRYEPLEHEVIGTSPSGQVFAGYDFVEQRDIAIKSWADDQAIDDFSGIAAFHGSQDHPCLVRSLEVDFARRWIVMERMASSLDAFANAEASMMPAVVERLLESQRERAF